MKKQIIFLLITSALILSACKKKVDPIDDGPTYTEDMRARDILYNLMGEWYFWYKDMPTVVKNDYDDPYTLLNAMRYRPSDRWSFVTDYESFTSYYEGTFAGHGIRIGLDTAFKARIAMIYERSPLYPEGVRRGWIVKSVNGTDIAALLASGNYAQYDAVMGARQPGVVNTFVFTTPEGNDVSITSAKEQFQVNSVLKYDILDLSSGKTGYLAFEAFIEPSFRELEDAFALFITNQIKDLIIDLRYNSGGMLDVAIDLASYIAGNAEAGNIFIKAIHNDKKTSENESVLLKTTGYSLSIDRMAVITTRETASASENIINGLMPYVDVKCFGDTTNGKPVGMYAFSEEKQLYVFAPVTFQLVNADNYGDYFPGFFPHEYAPDDITRDFGDPDELSLKAAIEYLESGGKKSGRIYEYKPAITVDERPDWQRNFFIRHPGTGK
jgi:carboxyl-terminal processing protease